MSGSAWLGLVANDGDRTDDTDWGGRDVVAVDDLDYDAGAQSSRVAMC